MNGGRRSDGQGLLEFALVVPVVLITFFVIIETARLLYTWVQLEHGARMGVRYAVTGEYDPHQCANGHLNGTCNQEMDEEPARLASIRTVVTETLNAITISENGVWDAPQYFKTTICVSPRHAGESHRYQPPDPDILYDSANCQGGDDAGRPGDFVSVTVDYNFPLIIPVFKDVWPQVHITTRREAIVESFLFSSVLYIPDLPGGPASTSAQTATQSTSTAPTYTPQPTATLDPFITPSATPDCARLYAEYNYRDEMYWIVRVRNDNEVFPYLIHSELTWPANACDDTMHFSRAYFPFYSYFEYYYQDTLLYESPVSSGPLSIYWPGDARPSTEWAARFNIGTNSMIFGDYHVDLTYEFTDWGTCVISSSGSFPREGTITPTITVTAGPSQTPASTHTPGGPTETRRVTRTLNPTATPGNGNPTTTCTPTLVPTITGTSSTNTGPGDF